MRVVKGHRYKALSTDYADRKERCESRVAVVDWRRVVRPMSSQCRIEVRGREGDRSTSLQASSRGSMCDTR